MVRSVLRPCRKTEMEAAMPITAFLDGKAFDPETIKIMDTAFHGACAELGLADRRITLARCWRT